MAVADTSRDAWVALACAFSNQSQSRIMSIRERLSSITKGTSSVSIHLLSIRNIADELALIGHPIDDLEMVIHTLNSLGPTFREFTASIRTRDSPIAFNELYDKLVDFEMYLQCEECLSTPIPVTTNVVQRYQHGQGASHHITNDLTNLTLKDDYHGNDNLQVANGYQLPITHIGSTTIPTNGSSLRLSDILYVPNVTQNLISVSQLCQTNKVSIEFFPWHFEVKDLRTRELLLQGLNEDNVYRFNPTAPSPYASCICSNSSIKLWHQRLGHPASPTLLHALKSNHISFSGYAEDDIGAQFEYDYTRRGSNHTSRRFRRVQAKHGVMNSINDYAESLFQMCSENGAGPKRDELNFEFLGNKTGEPYLTETNVYKNGTGGREMRHMLWFDPIEDYHTYSILWNNHQVV
ncbi:Retrovirus-related Pol polyprotein from transposon RE2 [Glycine soja]|uniref:Retrovirus-related Pol polyprotein from transposon RE2 n=2 Tax=Glycine soja TaxID=3848 RepID=A0A445GWR8_GLYSO|nr:Retrovirus-related Pol polyprotein from transposon RE2 [Glycine soja]